MGKGMIRNSDFYEMTDPFRLKMVLMPCNRDQYVCVFNRVFEESRARISIHLRILKDAEISGRTTGQIIRSTR